MNSLFSRSRKPWSVPGLLFNFAFVVGIGLAGLLPAHAATQTASPSSCVEDNSSGDNTWSNPDRAVSSNDSYATVSVDDGEQSNYLQCTNFGFTIPAGATIDGITVNIERKSGATNTGDRRVRIVKAGTRGSADLATGTGYPAADTVEAHGGSTQLWSETWTAADINSANFGAALSVEKTSNTGGARTVSVDHIQIVVSYTSVAPTVPTATTNAASSVTATGATLSGTVSSNGASTTVTFDYGLTAAYGSSATATASPLAAGASATAVSAAIAGLSCNTTYHFRVKGVNSVGTTNGSDLTFTTPCLPTATTDSSASVTTSGATLNGTVSSNGGSTTVTFDYGTTIAYGSSITASASPLAAGASGTAVSAALTGLSCNTTYHFRVKAVNGAGTTNGSDLTFTTSACPVFCTQPSNTPLGLTLTCVCDTFGRASLNPSTIFGGNWSVSTSDTTGILPSIINSGYLRLTNNTGNNAKAATVPGIFPAAGNYISVEFRHYAYNGSNPGADGVAVTLSDNSIPAVPGGFGGSLGYAQRNDGVLPPGFAGGWVGIALDEWGNYQNPTEGRVLGSGFIAQSVGVRGPGSGANGYRWMAGTASNMGGLSIDNRASVTPAPGYMYQVIVDARNFATGIVNVAVNRDSTTVDGSTYSPLFAAFNAYTEASYALGQGWITSLVPNYWKVSFTGATGGANNIHEIGSLRICAQTVVPTTGGTASGFSAIDDAYPGAPTVPAYPNFQTGHIYTKLTGTAFSLWVAALTGTGISTSYSGAGAKYVQVKLVDNTDNACGPDSARTCVAACTNKAGVEANATQIATFVSGGTTGVASPKPTFTLNSAYKNLLAVMKECTTSACTAFTATTPACSADSFSVRPTGFSSATSSDATNSATTGTPKFKAGTDTFSLTLTSTGIAGFPSKYTGAAKISPTVVAPATVVGTVAPTAFSAATSGTPSSTASGSTFTYSEAGAFKLLGYNPATDSTSPRGVYDGAQCGAITAAACDAIKTDGTTPTWTAVDSISTENDCITDSYSNTKVGGKYGCNFGLTADSATIGRFIPDHFSVTSPTTTAACSTGAAFTYFGQDGFTTVFTLTAQNASNVTTQNYIGNGVTSLAKLPLTTWGAAPASAASPGFGFAVGTWVPAQPAGANIAASATLPTASNANTWVAGTTTVTARHQISRPTNPAAATTVTVTALPVDSDGVTMATAAAIGSSLQRFGVLRVENAYGSELLPIRMAVRTLYCNAVTGTSCTDWRTNTDDGCTAVSSTMGGLAYGAVGTPLANGNFRITGTDPNTGAGTTGNWMPTSSSTLTSGAGTLILNKPCVGGPGAACTPATGSVDLTLTAPAWLQGRWSGAASGFVENPIARIKFGSPKAPYIYLRERY